MDVTGFHADVEVTHDAKGFIPCLRCFSITLQAVQPLQLVGVFVGRQRRAIRHVEIHDSHPIEKGADYPFLFPQLLGLRVAR